MLNDALSLVPRVGRADVLIFVEDPGAANYVAQLPSALRQKGWSTKLFAAGTARAHLLQRGVDCEQVQASCDAGRMLELESPEILVVGTSENPDTLGLELIRAARSRGIPTVGAVDAESNAGYRFQGRSESPLGYAPDWLLVPDQRTKDSYTGLGFRADRIMVCGHPHYDEVREAARQLATRDRSSLRQSMFPGAPPDSVVIVFVAEVSTGLNPGQYKRSAEYTLTGRGSSTGRTEIVLEELLDAAHLIVPRPFLVLRLHPKNTLDEFRPYLEEVDQVSRDEHPLEIVYAADLVVGMASMLLFEAAIMGRPTLSIVPRALEAQWALGVCIGTTPCVTTRHEFRSTLCSLLRRDMDTFRPPPLDPVLFRSLERTAGCIAQLLSAAR